MFQDIRRFVRKIPKGKVATYGQVAEAAGFPRASRQVAWALKDSPPDLPWQRVIGKATTKRGKILLRGANGVRQVQELTLEGVKVNGIFVDLETFGHEFNAKAKPAKRPARPRASGA
jgi:methylated-DNA-protein-cysteine methyltransferase-like protein